MFLTFSHREIAVILDPMKGLTEIFVSFSVIVLLCCMLWAIFRTDLVDHFVDILMAIDLYFDDLNSRSMLLSDFARKFQFTLSGSIQAINPSIYLCTLKISSAPGLEFYGYGNKRQDAIKNAYKFTLMFVESKYHEELDSD